MAAPLDPSFGTFAPTPAQERVIRLARATFAPDLMLSDGEALLMAGVWPVGWPVGEPPGGSSVTASTVRAAIDALIEAGYLQRGDVGSGVHVSSVAA